MKRILLAAFILSLAVFASAYTVRQTSQQLLFENENVMEYITAPAGTNDANWRLDVTDGIDVVSTTTHTAQLVRVETKSGPTGLAAFAFIDMQGFSTPGPSAGITVTFTLTYLLNDDPETNAYTWSKIMPTGSGPVFWATHNSGELYLPESILGGEPEPENTYWLRIFSVGLDEPGTLLKDGVVIGTTPYMPASSTDKSVFYGTYTMQDVAGGTWAPADLVIDEETVWPAIDGMADNYQIMETFEWTLDVIEPEPTYTLNLSTDPAGYITSPASSEDPVDLFGTYAPIGPVSTTGHWEPAQLVINEDFEEWIEDTDGNFYYNFEFVWMEETVYVDHYRVHVTTSDEAARAVIAPDTDYNGTTPYYTAYVLDKSVFYGLWKIENLSECWYPSITLDEDTVFTEVRAKGGENRGYVDRYFVYEMVFQRGENQTFTLFAQDIDTGLPIEGATVFFNGEVIGTTDAAGAFTRYCPFNYPGAGTWTLGHPDYCDWDPEAVESPAGPLTESVSFTMLGIPCGEPPVPVELSAFTATLTGDFFVNVAWTSQTETQMMGYRVYRNTTADQNGAMLIDHPMVPATNTSETQTYNVKDTDVMVGTTYYYWLEAVEYNTSNFHGPVSVTVTGNVPPVLPEVTSMKNAYPNPFKAGNSTNIEVSLKAGETGSLTIYNVMGQVVKTVSLNEGTHTVNWNGRDSKGAAVGSGIYFYKLSTPSLNQTKKMVIVK